jgi:prepilin-type N-terminal cleavage/methylation domain-containing protein
MRPGSNRLKSRGFTLIEVLVTAALIAVGVTAALGALGALTRAEVDLRDRERLERLAHDRYMEMVATGEYAQAPMSGDFADRGYPNFRWQAELTPSTVESLESFSISAENSARAGAPVRVSGLVFRQPLVGGAQ